MLFLCYEFFRIERDVTLALSTCPVLVGMVPQFFVLLSASQSIFFDVIISFNDDIKN